MLIALVFCACGTTPKPVPNVPSTVVGDSSLAQAEIQVAGKKRRVHVHETGEPDAPVLFLMHDVLADSSSLEAFDALSSDYYVVRWDRRGAGLSERTGAGETGLAQSLEEIEALRKLYSPEEPITLVGHGVGGVLAAAYTSHNPEQVTQLVLLEPAGLSEGVLRGSLRDAYIGLRALGQSTQEIENPTVEDHARMDHRARPILEEDGLVGRMCSGPGPSVPLTRPGGWAGIRLWLELVEEHESVLETLSDLEDYPHQVLVLAGDCSPLGYDFQMTENGPAFGRAVILKITGGGHWFWLEEWSATMGAIESYLEVYR